MTTPVPLDTIDHHDLRVAMRHGPDHGDAVNQLLAVPGEFEPLAREFPILFRRDDAGTWRAVVLLGLERGENLFLDGDRWTSRTVPAVQARGPFSVALRPDTGEATIHVDLDDPRISRDTGEPLFLPHGGHAPALQRATRSLQLIGEGLPATEAMFAALDGGGLIEPVAITVTLDSSREIALNQYHTVAADRLAGLDGDTLSRLNRAGVLRLAFLVQASLGNMARLIELKNARRG
ncbi:SapC family protein [Croceibacterium ferulae]|uniref:SapC family protein n=1 Tax=Croceibacterium ferulae TaxID=1854641 RepID=UPI000EAC52C1|nr:SapC family protein [Croceibacterium ferulae]